MTNAPSKRADHCARRRDDAYRPSAEAIVLWPRDRGSAHPYERHVSIDHGRQPHHRLPSHMVPPRYFDSLRQETWLRPQEPVSSLSHPRPAAEDTQRGERVIHLGHAYYSDHHPHESGFGYNSRMTDYYGQSNDQRQKERPERMQETSIHPGSRWELDEHETRHRSSRQRSIHPNMVSSVQTLPPENFTHHRRHDSSYDQASPRHSSHTYGIAEDDIYVAEGMLGQAPYSDDYHGHVDHQNTHRSRVEQGELRNTEERVQGGFISHPIQASNAGRQRHYNAQFHGNVRQSSREASPASRTQWNDYDMRGRHIGSRGPHEKEESMVRRDCESNLADRHHEAPLASEETVTYARDRVSNGDERMTGTARQRSGTESGHVQSFKDEEEAKKERAMNFAVESYKRGELEEIFNCGSPYLEQAARILQQNIRAAEAAKRANQWRAKPLLKPVRAGPSNGPFVESDEDEDREDDEEVTPSSTAGGRNPGQDGSSTTVETAAPKQATPSSGAVKSRLLRERARHDTPIRASGYDSDIGSIFEGSNAFNDDEEPLFVPKTSPVEQKHSDLENAADPQLDLTDSSRREPSPEMATVRDQNLEDSLPSNAAPSPFSMMSRDQMAKIMAERNRATEVISQRPQVSHIAKTTQPPLAEIGDSRERAISISSEKSESPLSDSSSDEHDENGDAEGSFTAEQRRTKQTTRALELIQSSATSPTPVKSTTARNSESDPKPTTPIQSTAATTPARKPEAQPKASTATPAASYSKIPKENGMQSEKSKKQKGEKQQTLESFGEDIMALRAEMARQKQQKREAEEQMEQLALLESEEDNDDRGEGPQIDVFTKVSSKQRGRPPGPTAKKIVEKKPVKSVKKKAPPKQLSSELIASVSEESHSDADTLKQTAVQCRGQKNGTLGHSGPISMHNYALLKRKPEESASLKAKKRKTSPEQEQSGKLRLDSEDNRHGLPALESPIASPEMNSFLEKYGGNTHAMKAHAPTCAQVLADEMDCDDTKINGNLRSPRLKRTTPPPKPIKTSDLRPAYRKGKAWPEAVHVPIEDQEEPDGPAAKPAKRSPKTPRKAARQGENAPGSNASVPEDHDGIIMVHQNFATPPSNRGAHCLPLCEADKLLVKWRNAGLKWDYVRTLYANETNRILTPKSLYYRHKRVLEQNTDLAAAAARKSDVPPPDDGAEEDEGEAGSAKPGPGGKTWNMDALEAYYANQREIDAFLTSGEDETDEELLDDEQEPRRPQSVRGKTPEPLDKNECWWMYQVWRKSWTIQTEQEKEAMRKEKMAKKEEMESRKKEKEMRKKDRELKKKKKEAETMEKKEMQENLSRFLGPTVGDQDEGSDTMSESDSDSDSGSEPEEEEVDEEEVDPEEAAEPYVVGAAYYRTLDDANEAAGIEMCGSRFGIGGIGPTEATGLISHTSKVGPHGMFVLQAHYFNNFVVRVWVDRFARAPGTADPPDVSKRGWLAKMVWAVKRKEVEVRRTRRADGVEAAYGDAMEVDEESNIIAIKDLATFTVLDGANSEAAQCALDHAYPPSKHVVEQMQARIEAKKHFDIRVQQYDETNTAFSADFEGEEEVISSGGGMVTTKRTVTTFWVEGAMLQGPRNV